MKILLLLILSLFVADVAGAATYWVHPSGNNGACTNTTTPQGAGGNAKTTIAAGVACLGSGDTLNIRTGSYTESITGTIPSGGGSYATATTIQAYCPTSCPAVNGVYGPASGVETVTLNGRIDVVGGDRTYIIFKNFKVVWAGTGNPGIGLGDGGNPSFINHHIKLDGMEVTGTSNNFANTSAGIRVGVGNSGADSWITNTSVHDSMASSSSSLNAIHCYYVEGHRALIENSTCYNWHVGAGIHHYTGDFTINDVIVRNNVLRDIGATDGSTGGGAMVLANGQNTQVYNNLIYNNDEGIFIFSGCTNCQVLNNTLYNNQHNSHSNCCYPTISGNGVTGIARNNIVSGNVDNTVTSVTTSNNLCSSAGTGCASNEPASSTFINPGTDFHLKLGSVAINPTPPLQNCPITDIVGTPRPQGSSCDIGAYEFVTGAITWASNRGGALDSLGRTGPNSGSASLSGSNWTISNIPLSAGINNLSVLYTDTSGVQTTDNLVVTYAPTFPGNALVGAWAFESNGTDSSGNIPPNTVTLLNGPTYNASGKFGAALSFDGINDYARVGDANSLDSTQSFTFSAWVFPTGTPAIDYKAAITKNYMIALYASSGSPCSTGVPSIYFRVNGQSGPDYFACGSTPAPINSWTYLAGTYDGPGPNSNLRLYVNGVLATTMAATGYIEPSDLSMQIGASTQNNVVMEYFQGRIDEARVYNWAIPRTGTLNTTPNSTCTAAQFAENVASPSIVGNMNCSIIATVSPLVFKLPADPSGLKLGAGASFKVGQP